MDPAVSVRKRGRPPSRSDESLSRDALLGLALERFARDGYQGFSVRKLAQQLGVSHGLINIRVGNKERLWQECIGWGLEKLAGKLVQTPMVGPIESRLREAIVLILMAIEAVPSLLLLVNHEGATDSPRLDDLIDGFFAHQCTVLGDLVDEGVRAGIFRPMPGGLVFLLVAHGGGAPLAMNSLGRKMGAVGGDRGEVGRTLAEVIADFVIRGLRT